MTQLEIALRKNTALGSQADHYLILLRAFPEGQLFEPSNRKEESYTICDHLFHENLITRVTAPLWHNGSLRGTRVSFLYKEDLDYPTYKLA